MKKCLAAVLVIALILPGCSTMKDYKKTTIGTGAGGILGAGLGYAIGGGEGAAVGAVVGGLLGGGIGYMMDKQEREFKEELAQSKAREQDATRSDTTQRTACSLRKQEPRQLHWPSALMPIIAGIPLSQSSREVKEKVLPWQTGPQRSWSAGPKKLGQPQRAKSSAG